MTKIKSAKPHYRRIKKKGGGTKKVHVKRSKSRRFGGVKRPKVRRVR